MEEFVILRGEAKDLVQVVAIGVGDEGLPEGISTDECHDALNALGIEAVKDVVQKQYGTRAVARVVKEIVLSQLEGHEHGLVLSLTTLTTDGIAVYHHLQVVAMYAMQGVAHGKILVPVALNNIEQGTSLAMTCV